MVTRARAVLISAALCSAAVAACRAPPPPPDVRPGADPAPRAEPAAPAAIAWIDDLGRAVTLAAPAARVVSLSPALTEILFAVGCGETLVLRDAWSDYPAGATRVPAIQGFVPSAEAIVALKPDLLLANFPPTALRGALDAAGVSWAAFSPVRLDQIAVAFERIGQACGQPTRGARLRAAFERDVRQIREAVSGLSRPKVFYEMDAGHGGRPYTVGPGSFAQDLIEAAGGTNAFADSGQAWLQVSAEAVVAARPDVVVLADAGAIENAQTAVDVAARPGWRAVEAVAQGRIYALNTDWVARPGPRLVLGLRQLAALLHPDRVGPPGPTPDDQAARP